MKKNRFTLLVCLALCLALLSACNSGPKDYKDADGNDTRVGAVYIVNDGDIIEPPGVFVFEQFEDGTVTDIQAPTPQEMSASAPTFTLADDFAVSITGTVMEEPDFLLFDDNFDMSLVTKDITELPPGTHTVVMAVFWGEMEEHIDYWHYFNLEVPA